MEEQRHSLYPEVLDNMDDLKSNSFSNKDFEILDVDAFNNDKPEEFNQMPPEMRDQSNEIFDKYGMIKGFERNENSQPYYNDHNSDHEGYGNNDYQNNLR